MLKTNIFQLILGNINGFAHFLQHSFDFFRICVYCFTCYVQVRNTTRYSNAIWSAIGICQIELKNELSVQCPVNTFNANNNNPINEYPNQNKTSKESHYITLNGLCSRDLLTKNVLDDGEWVSKYDFECEQNVPAILTLN